MTTRELIIRRLLNQQIVSARANTPADVVSTFGAMQAQDYTSALWAIGARLPGSTEADIERAIAERKIVRTWPMRGTLHFVAAADVRWMLELLTPRITARAASRHRELELDEITFARCRKIFIKALGGDRQLTRGAMLELLEKSNIPITGQRGYHILWQLSQEGLLCCAARSGKQQTFALLDDWVPASRTRRPGKDEALSELATRYFASHGPATLQDFVWWSGLTVAAAKTGLTGTSKKLSRHTVDDTDYWMSVDAPPLPPSTTAHAHLLPAFDEYLLGYKDRRAMLDPAHSVRVVPGGNGMFLPVCLSRGRIVGTWKRNVGARKAVLTLNIFDLGTSIERRSVENAAHRYGEFLGLPVEVKS